MAEKVGFLSRNKANGFTYINLRKSERVIKNGKSQVIKTNIFRFGRVEKAIENMYTWRDDFDKFPKELKDLGYDFDDLQDWILTLETNVTKTGKSFIF